MKTTQIEIVRNQLREHGEVSRNWCLSQYISRLSAIILDLAHEGYEFKTFRRDGDYVYMLLNAPKRRVCSFEDIERDGVRMKREIVSYI